MRSSFLKYGRRLAGGNHVAIVILGYIIAPIFEVVSRHPAFPARIQIGP